VIAFLATKDAEAGGSFVMAHDRSRHKWATFPVNVVQGFDITESGVILEAAHVLPPGGALGVDFRTHDVYLRTDNFPFFTARWMELWVGKW